MKIGKNFSLSWYRARQTILGKKKGNEEDGGEKGEHGDDKLLKKAHKLLYTKYPQYQHIDIGKLSIVIYPQKTIFWRMLSRENN